MPSKPLNILSYPKAIIHIDGDCFFASCEVAKNPALKGKPVVTGVERGIVSSLTYEAKARGVVRAMSLKEVKRICPDVILLPSDYETYSLYSMRMFSIVRRYTPTVEEYSIDECFADITGLQRPLNMSYEAIAQKIKQDLDRELGMTFSVGLAPTKVVAKIGSKWKKPSGFTPIPGHNIHLFLEKLSIDKIWGIGPQTTAYLNKLGIRTAYDFASKDKEWIQNKLTKPHYEIWQELRGQSVYELNTEEKHNYQSISKTKTFTPSSNDASYVFSQLSKNIENACIKARRHNLVSKKCFVYAKSQDFKYCGVEILLSRATNAPLAIIKLANENFKTFFNAKKDYRATGIVLMDLKENKDIQLDLFSDQIKIEKIVKVVSSLDMIDEKYGKHTIFYGSSFEAMTQKPKDVGRTTISQRKLTLIKGETSRIHIGIPLLGTVR